MGITLFQAINREASGIMYSLPVLALLICGLDGAGDGAQSYKQLEAALKLIHDTESLGQDYKDLVDSTEITAGDIVNQFQEVDQSTSDIPRYHSQRCFEAFHPSVLCRGDGPVGTHYLEVKVLRTQSFGPEYGSMYFIFARGYLHGYYYVRRDVQKGVYVQKGWRISNLAEDLTGDNTKEYVLLQIQHLVKGQAAVFSFPSDELRHGRKIEGQYLSQGGDGTKVKVRRCSGACPSTPPVKKDKGSLHRIFC